MLWSRRWPEPDFLAKARAGEKEKIGTGTLKKTKLLTLVFKTALFTLTCATKMLLSTYPKPGAGSRNRSRSRLDRLDNTGPLNVLHFCSLLDPNTLYLDPDISPYGIQSRIHVFHAVTL